MIGDKEEEIGAAQIFLHTSLVDSRRVDNVAYLIIFHRGLTRLIHVI